MVSPITVCTADPPADARDNLLGCGFMGKQNAARKRISGGMHVRGVISWTRQAPETFKVILHILATRFYCSAGAVSRINVFNR